MPVLENENPWANALLMLSGEMQGQAAAQQQALQNRLQQQQLAQQQLQQQGESDYRDKQLKLQAAEYGLNPDTDQPLPTTAKYDPPPTNPKPGDMAAWASSQLVKAASANDVAGIDRFTKAVNALSQTDVREEGTIPLDKARVSQIQDYVKNHYKQQFDLLQAKLHGEAQLRMMAAYHKAGGGSANNTPEREAIALATALNHASGEEYSEANRNAQEQVTRDVQFYEQTYNAKTGQGFNMQTGGMSASPPSTTINVSPPTVYTVVNVQIAPVDARTGQPVKPAPNFHGLPPGTRFTSNGKPMIVGPDGQPHPAPPLGFQASGSVGP